MKATHRGTCQWCGAIQRLPDGRLARHGYTVRNHWQQGICPGSGHLPYELSAGLIAESVEHADAQLIMNEQKQKAVQAIDPETSTKAWLHVYHRELSSRTSGSVYIWEEHELVPDEFSEFWHLYVDTRGNRHRLENPARLADRVREGKTNYWQHLNAIGCSIIEYVERQEARVRAWRKKPLLELSH